MAAELDDFAALQHVDSIRMKNGRETVRDEYGDCVPRGGDVPDCVADLLFGQRVERRSGFIEDEQLRSTEQCARDGQALLLPSRNLDSTFPNDCVQAPVCPGKKAVDGSLPQDSEAFIIGSAGANEQEIFANRSPKTVALLRYKTDALAETFHLDLIFTDPVV